MIFYYFKNISSRLNRLLILNIVYVNNYMINGKGKVLCVVVYYLL